MALNIMMKKARETMSEKTDYFFAELDSNLIRGLSPKDALIKTVENYQYVYELNTEKIKESEES